MKKPLAQILIGAAPHIVTTVAAAFLLDSYQDGFLWLALILLTAHLALTIGLHIRTGIPEPLILAYALAAIASYLLCWKVIPNTPSPLDGTGFAVMIYAVMLVAFVAILRAASLILNYFKSKARVNK